ncbi:MAG: aldehyde dehydrogenase [Candidatus Latescibacteria bacterium]|nr:aldehyde dehydrogenase [Candidatus Latescibacterota bacterium]
MQSIKNYINGELVDPISETFIENPDPATGAIYSLVPDSDEPDVLKAVTSAAEAYPAWSDRSSLERASFLSSIAGLLRRDLERLSLAESVDNGKPVSLARAIDIPRAASNFEFYATAIQQFSSEAHPMEGTALNYTLRNPIGVAGCISPWNLPLYLFTWKIAPALAAGNCVVAKPSELTPMTAYLLSELCIEAGLPPGVLNIVHGYGHKVGSAITRHPDVPVLSFTGGTKTGATIAATAAPMFKKLSLELGGKNPNIIFADCDYDTMLDTTIRSSFANQGEICLCGSRIYVEQSIYDKFRRDFVARTAALTIDDPLDEKSQLGAIVSKAHMEKILAYVELARQEGGEILVGGKQVYLEGRCRDGWFVAPTVIEGLSSDCRTNQEEIFGPVVTLSPFESEEEVLGFANGTAYGLAASLWTENLTRAHRVANHLQAGIVWINCWMLRDLRTPFGGMKQSGVGREGGIEALRFFTEAKNVCVKI